MDNVKLIYYENAIVLDLQLHPKNILNLLKSNNLFEELVYLYSLFDKYYQQHQIQFEI
jgi:hypothetical protein